MNLRSELFQQLVRVIREDRDDEPERQPSRPLDAHDLHRCLSSEVPASLQWPLEMAWAICRQQWAHRLLSCRLARRDDADVELLGDFYQRACLVSLSAAAEAQCRGHRVQQALEQRHADDLRIIRALAGEGAIFPCVPTRERLEFYRLSGLRAASALLWNNLVRFYSGVGIGFLEEPRNGEQRFAASLLNQELEGQLILAFADGGVWLQILQGSQFYLHARSARELAVALARLPKELGLDIRAAEVA